MGIVIDEKLNFKNHVGLISSKISRSIGILYRLNAFVPTEVLKMLYYSLVHPYLNYCIDSWYGASQSLSNSVFILQKKSIRAIFGLPYNGHTSQFFKQNNILKLCDLYKLNLACTMFNYINYISKSLKFSCTHITEVS